METLYDRKRKFFEAQISGLFEAAVQTPGIFVQDFIDELDSGTFADMRVETRIVDWKPKTYIIQNETLKCEIQYILSEREQKALVTFSIKEPGGLLISSQWEMRTSFNTIKLFMSRSSRLAHEFRTFTAGLEKNEKINSIAKGAVCTWLESILKDTGYSYCITEAEGGVTLSVRLDEDTQADIPVGYKTFQTIIPEILNTVKLCEEAMKNRKVKALIVNSPPGKKWKKG